jgi:antitoxin ParD1/3/4
MRSTRQMSITLPLAMADSVQSRVASGRYASESEVIREGLRALDERDEAVEHWLRTEVAATYDAHKAAPNKTGSLDEAWQRLEARMDAIDQEEI